MTVLSRFYGIVIRMYFMENEHNKPHIHAIYGEDVASIAFLTGEILDGELPPRAFKLVNEWISLHREELTKIWQTQKFLKIEPLR